MAKRTIGILGLGIFGSTIAKTLSQYDCDVIAIDKGEENVNRLEPYVTKGVVGDITDDEQLEAAGIASCDVVIVATGSSLEASVLAILHCKKMGIPEIIAKAKSRVANEILVQMGANKVISPEKETWIRVAKNILHRKISDVIKLDNNISLIEFYPPKKWVGKTLQALDLRNKYDMILLGYRMAPHEKLNIQFTADYRFTPDELLVALTESEVFEREDYLNELGD